LNPHKLVDLVCPDKKFPSEHSGAIAGGTPAAELSKAVIDVTLQPYADTEAHMQVVTGLQFGCF
jgi:hypothetical protein